MKTSYKKITLSPFLFFSPSLNTCSKAILLALVPQLFLLAAGKSYQSLVIIGVAVAASYGAELAYNIKHRLSSLPNGVFLLQGLFTGMFIPASYPPAAVFIISLVSFLLVKYTFGGGSNSWINPVCFTIILLYFFGPSYFPQSAVTADLLKSGNPAQQLISSGAISVSAADERITAWFNIHLFSYLGIEIPDGYVSMFWDTHSAIPAFRFNFLTLVASVFLLSGNVIKWLVPLLYISVYGLLVRTFAVAPFTGIYWEGDILLALLSSGTLFAAFFLLDWQGTVPLNTAGKILYGSIAGCVAFFVSGCGTSPIGSMFTVLLMNIVSPLIQLAEDRLYAYRIAKRYAKKEQQYV